MADFIESMSIFLIFAFSIFALLGAMETVHTVNVGNCWSDTNGTLQNCSISNNDYALLNNTYMTYAQTSSIMNYLLWILLVVVIVAGVMLFARLRRN
jgi:hypothetical protein